MPKNINHNLSTDRDCTDQRHPLVHTRNCMIYLHRGQGCLNFRGRTFAFLQGQCCFIPRSSTASYWAESENGWEYVWIEFDGQLFDEVLHQIVFTPENPIRNASAEQAELFIQICDRKYNFSGGEYYYTMGLVMQLLSSFVDTIPSESKVSEDGSMRALLSFIHSNLCRRDLTVEYLAQIMGVGRTTLYHRFKTEVGCSPSEYIQKRRINNARHLLHTTKLSVAQVSSAVGYDDPLYFSRVFRKAAGCSPTHYRRFFQKMAGDE